jgi:hypothetical protein
MRRVCKGGGIVFVKEPDANFLQTYPETKAYPKLKEFINLLFADALLGRKLISFFKRVRLEKVNYQAESVLADHHSTLKKFYTMTAVALEEALIERGLIDKRNFDEWIAEMRRIENDSETIVLTPPTISIWGLKAQ